MSRRNRRRGQGYLIREQYPVIRIFKPEGGKADTYPAKAFSAYTPESLAVATGLSGFKAIKVVSVGLKPYYEVNKLDTTEKTEPENGESYAVTGHNNQTVSNGSSISVTKARPPKFDESSFGHDITDTTTKLFRVGYELADLSLGNNIHPHFEYIDVMIKL